MRRSLLLSVIFVFLVMSFPPQANAYPTKIYLCSIWNRSVLSSFSLTYVVGLEQFAFLEDVCFGDDLCFGEDAGIMFSAAHRYIPTAIIGNNGWFIVLNNPYIPPSFGEGPIGKGFGYVDDSLFFDVFQNTSESLTLILGIPLSKVADFVLDNPENPSSAMPTDEYLQLLASRLIEARLLFPHYSELIDNVLASIDLNSHF